MDSKTKKLQRQKRPQLLVLSATHNSQPDQTKNKNSERDTQFKNISKRKIDHKALRLTIMIFDFL